MSRSRFLRPFFGLAFIAIALIALPDLIAATPLFFELPLAGFTEFMATAAPPINGLSLILMVMTLGAALFFKAKILSFLSDVMRRRVDRYVMPSV